MILDSRSAAGQLADVQKHREAAEHAKLKLQTSLPLEQARLASKIQAEYSSRSSLDILLAQAAEERAARQQRNQAQRQTATLEWKRRQDQFSARGRVSYPAFYPDGQMMIQVFSGPCSPATQKF